MSRLQNFLNLQNSPTLSWVKRKTSKFQNKKKVLSFLKKVSKGFMDVFSEDIYGVRLLHKWASRTGYVILFILSLSALVIADQFDFTRTFIHSTGVNEAIIGTFTVLLTLMIPLAIALIFTITLRKI